MPTGMCGHGISLPTIMVPLNLNKIRLGSKLNLEAPVDGRSKIFHPI
jgi:hypothetical protein